jgi:uncharacterized protein YjdB
VIQGQTVTATAAALDQSGAPLTGRTVTWTTGSNAIATVTSAGVVTGVAAGQTSVIATIDGKTGQSTLTVTAIPVATVNVAPSAASLAVGATQQLTATTLDANGNTLTGRVVAWSSSDQTKATVNTSGLVTAAAAGTATITATSETKSGTSTITVNAVAVASVTVAPTSGSLAAGGTLQLTATTRDANANILSGRTVTWSSSDGTKASVSTTGLVTGVAAGNATITAASEGKSGTSAITVTGSAQVCSTQTALQLALGEVRTLTAAQVASLCLGGSASASEYVLIPFGNSTVAANATPIQVASTNTGATLSTPLAARGGMGAGALPVLQASPSDQMELAFRARERRDIGSLRARTVRSALRSPALSPSYLTNVPSVPAVGSVVQLNSSVSGNTCSDPKQLHPARVVAVLTHTIVLIDTLAPAGGYTNAELTAFGTGFDTLGFALDTLNFGTPTDIDNNGRVAIFFTTGVNVVPAPPGAFVLGLQASRDLFFANPSGCTASNEGEMFYMPVPDPNRTINGSYASKTTLSNGVLGTLVHEFQHMINAGRRIYVNNASTLEEVWLNEGLSHSAEEVLYYRMSGNSPRTNLALSVLTSSQAQVDAFNNFENSNFGRLRTYLAAPSINSPFAQVDGLEMRGAIWQLLRYSVDRKGGNERNLWFALVNSTTTGQANFDAVLGDIITFARDWAVAQFTGNDGLGVAANYTNPSWNFRSIFPAVTSPPAFPIATSSLVGGVPVALTMNGGGAAYVRFRVAATVLATVTITSSGLPPANVDFILVRTQ